jgi:hypothetical protein
VLLRPSGAEAVHAAAAPPPVEDTVP